jgi:hypothetical protein
MCYLRGVKVVTCVGSGLIELSFALNVRYLP